MVFQLNFFFKKKKAFFEKKIKEAYPNVEPVNRLNVVNKEIPDPN
jgi:hypothetical protein